MDNIDSVDFAGELHVKVFALKGSALLAWSE